MERKPTQPRIPALSWPAFLLAVLPVGALVFLALVSRIYAFWFLSRWPRLFVFGVGAGACSLLVGLALRSAWSRLRVAPRAGRLAWLGAAFAFGLLGIALLGGRPAAMPLMHVLDISTPGAGAGGSQGGPVVIIELRDHTGRVVPPVDFQLEGDWQRSAEGWVAQNDHPARLHYSFYAPSAGKLQVLFGEQPGGGKVLVELNGQSQQIDLSSSTRGQRLVELPFQKRSRWEMPVFIANLVLLGIALPLFLFVAPFYVVSGVHWSWPRLRSLAAWLSASLDYQKWFIVVFLGICLLPLFDYRGDLKSLDSFFLQGNRFWPVYSRIRQNVFGDRFIGGGLVARDGWLLLANDFSLEDYQNTVPFTQEELYQIQQRIDSTTRFFKEQGITFLVVVPPNKNTIYPEMMPAQIEVIGAQSRLDQLLAYQRAHGQVQILDLRPALREARKEHLVYYRTDTHWNDYGAHAAYMAIIRELQKDFPFLQPHTLDQFRYVSDQERVGDIGFRWIQGARPEPYFSLKPTFDRRVYKLETSQDRILYTYQYNQVSGKYPNAVIFHDSFMTWLAPFLSDNLGRAVFSRYLDSDKAIDESLIVSEKPDIVIFECNERLLKKLLNLPRHE